MAQLRALLLLLSLVFLVQERFPETSAGRFSGGGRSRSSSSSRRGGFTSWFSRGSGSSSRSKTSHVHHEPTHHNVNTGTQRPIGFANPYSRNHANQDSFLQHETMRQAPPQHSVSSAVQHGTQRPIGFVDPHNAIPANTQHNPYKPSAPKDVHETVQKSPTQQSVNSAFNSGTQRPIGFVNPYNPNPASGNTQNNPYKPSAPKEVHEAVQKSPTQQSVNTAFNSGTQRPIGFVNPYNPNQALGSTQNNPYKPSAPKEVYDSHNQKLVNNGHGGLQTPNRRPYNGSSAGYGVHDTMHQTAGRAPLGNSPYGYGNGYAGGSYGNNYHPGSYGYGSSYPRNDYSSWYHQPYSGGTTHINYGPVNYMHGYPSYSGSSYHYTSNDVGSGTLGFFLGYGLGRLTSPSYYHHQYNPSSVYHYDHYTVHHYYHNKETVPQQLTVQPNVVVACAGNSSLLCPPNTVALCMSNGTIMCVAKPETLIRCPDNSGAYCVPSAIPNLNTTSSTAKQNNPTNTTIINIPCISNATLYGSLTYQNNSLVLQDARNVTGGNNTTNLMSNSNTPQNLTKTDVSPIVFCITVIAEPAVKKPDAAVLYDKFKGNALHFFTKALGAD